MAADDRTPSAVYALKQRLEALESEKSELLAELTRLRRNQDAVAEPRAPSAATGSVSAASDAAAKIKLFRSLFRGRDEVFPRRWQNANSGKSGYSPVCRNEWVRGICEKPRVKCGECPHQAFVPVTDDVIRSHLQGTDRDAAGRQSGAEYIARAAISGRSPSVGQQCVRRCRMGSLRRSMGVPVERQARLLLGGFLVGLRLPARGRASQLPARDHQLEHLV